MSGISSTLELRVRGLIFPLEFRPLKGGGGEGWLVARSSERDRNPPGPILNDVSIRVDKASSYDGGATRGWKGKYLLNVQ